MRVTKSGKNWFVVKFDATADDQALARQWLGLSRRKSRPPFARGPQRTRKMGTKKTYPNGRERALQADDSVSDELVKSAESIYVSGD